jgi:hypothetical protein
MLNKDAARDKSVEEASEDESEDGSHEDFQDASATEDSGASDDKMIESEHEEAFLADPAGQPAQEVADIPRGGAGLKEMQEHSSGKCFSRLEEADGHSGGDGDDTSAASSSGEDEGTCIRPGTAPHRTRERAESHVIYLGTPLQGSNERGVKRTRERLPEEHALHAEHAAPSGVDLAVEACTPTTALGGDTLLSTSVLPSSSALRGCHSGVFQVPGSDPVKKRLRFEDM